MSFTLRVNEPLAAGTGAVADSLMFVIQDFLSTNPQIPVRMFAALAEWQNRLESDI
jgi:hypothetical protein